MRIRKVEKPATFVNAENSRILYLTDNTTVIVALGVTAQRWLVYDIVDRLKSGKASRMMITNLRR